MRWTWRTFTPASRRDERRRLDVLPQPELEHQQAPEPMPMVDAGGLVLVEQPRDLARAEPAAPARERVVRELAQVVSEPTPQRDATSRGRAARKSGERGSRRAAGTRRRLADPSRATDRGTRPASSRAMYRSYPANDSSPPSPVSATVTCRRACSQMRKVGNAASSPSGSSNAAARRGSVSATSVSIASSSCTVPYRSATARAYARSSYRSSSKPTVKV